ncbi:YceG-like family protein [Salsuginibacillus halophilus]|uniref:YceG-like family protein n=1 Tax=Salsuginibacillus halophilus TaxID=517424 RepID=A0A2P8H7Z1_9BACI|nr:endolytic transglycosylase MltG [Salsuginibacillus halophilus]PSL42314.1 YceG-like family protein [Salsuginibacillus halophilus]
MHNWLRGAAAGLFVSAMLLLAAQTFLEPSLTASEAEESAVTQDEARQVLEVEGYEVMSDEDINAMLQEAYTQESDEAEGDDEAEEEANSETETENDPIYKYHLTVEDGMTSNEVASRLESANIIEDASRFESRLYEAGTAESIQTGTFELESEMEEEEIIQHISR